MLGRRKAFRSCELNAGIFLGRLWYTPCLLQEYTGIDAGRLEGMEDRLRDDILAEARKYGGRVLVSRESGDGEWRAGTCGSSVCAVRVAARAWQ